MMSEAQLEAAARKYCELAGIDPDERVSHGADPPRGGGFVSGILLYSVRWERVALDLKEHEMVLEAIQFGRGTGGEG